MSEPSNEVKRPWRKNPFLAFRSHLIDNLNELNLFDDDPVWSPTLTNSEQILSTRLFLLLMSISLLIVITYSSLTIVTHEVTLNKFSLNDFERLEKVYSHTINVPCSEVSISYKKFLNLSPIFHEVCSSPFISNEWISSLFLLNGTSHNILDFRTFGYSQYRSLRLFCRISHQSVKDNHRTFDSTYLTNRYVFSRNQFNEISSVLFNNFQRNILTNEKQSSDIISIITSQNRLISALRTNCYIQSKPGSKEYSTYNGVYLIENETNDSICDCRLNRNQCVYPAGLFYNWTLPKAGKAAKNDPPPSFQIPGLMSGCTPFDSIRQSTLECLYNQSCVNLISLQPEISRPLALNKSLTRFSLNSKIGFLFDEYLFVESWENSSNFENYFSACAPQSLSYSYQSRFDFERIITLSLSAFGGLLIGFKLITPIFIQIFNFIKSKKRKKQSFELTAIESELVRSAPKRLDKVVISHVNRTISNFNIFPSDKKDNIEEERLGILSTRLYIVLISFTLIILGIITCLSEQNQMNLIKFPSISQFEELNLKYSSTLNCPCSHFSMSYRHIMSLTPRYHSICSSDYLKSYWLSYFGRVEINLDDVYFLATDFRVSGQTFFGLLKILCPTSNETIENALIAFRNNRLVTMNTLSSKEFHLETERRLKSFEKQTISSFVHLIQLIRSAIQTNQLAEEMWTNLGPYSIFNNQTSKWSLNFRPRDFYRNSCSCALSNQCSRPVGFYLQTDGIRDKPNITVPGLVLGCYSIDSLLLSTLECLYEEKCLQTLIDYYYFDVVGLVHPLDDRVPKMKPLSNDNSRFLPNTTIEEIFSQLFVEDWINSTNFSSYYSRCRPLQCSYTVRKRFSTAYMFTIMLGFYGGLTAILDIILPMIVKLFTRIRNKQKQINVNTTDSPSNDCLKFCSLNLFGNDSSSSNERLKYEEIVTTRIYLLFLLISMIVAFLYYGPFSREKKSIIHENPSIDLIENLQKKNISSLSCPCSKVAIRYSKFLSIEPEFNPICSSEVVSPSYQLNLFENQSLELLTHSRMLSSLCFLAKEFIQDCQKVFRHRELITVEIFKNETFYIEIKSLIKNFIRQTKSDYRRRIFFVMNSFHVNQLLNLFTKNWKIDFTDQNEDYLIKTIPTRFSSSNCTCAISSNCHEKLIDQIEIGCFPYDGFRFSSDQNISFQLLNNRLFVDQWINKINYTNYFNICRPLKCQYTVSDRNNPIFISQTLLGLYGGLTYFLHFIVGQFLLAYRWWRREETTSYL